MEQLTPDDRIAAQEKARDAVHCELALLRLHMDARFAGVDAQFANMRQYVDDGLVKLRLAMQIDTRDEIAKAIAPLQAQMDALRNHVDSISRWGFRMLATILVSQVALAAFSLMR